MCKEEQARARIFHSAGAPVISEALHKQEKLSHKHVWHEELSFVDQSIIKLLSIPGCWFAEWPCISSFILIYIE